MRQVWKPHSSYLYPSSYNGRSHSHLHTYHKHLPDPSTAQRVAHSIRDSVRDTLIPFDSDSFWNKSHFTQRCVFTCSVSSFLHPFPAQGECIFFFVCLTYNILQALNWKGESNWAFISGKLKSNTGPFSVTVMLLSLPVSQILNFSGVIKTLNRGFKLVWLQEGD